MKKYKFAIGEKVILDSNSDNKESKIRVDGAYIVLLYQDIRICPYLIQRVGDITDTYGAEESELRLLTPLDEVL